MDAKNSVAARDGPPANLVEISGMIKWFDIVKGYGFVIPDNGMPDVFLHRKCLQRRGFDTIAEGVHIVCEVYEKSEKKWEAWRVLSMDTSTAIEPLRQVSLPKIVPKSSLVPATVMWYNHRKGYGFVTEGEGTPDILIRTVTLKRFDMPEPQSGQKVLVRWGEGPKGRTVVEIKRYHE